MGKHPHIITSNPTLHHSNYEGREPHPNCWYPWQQLRETKGPAESDLQKNQGDKRHRFWTRGENLTQTSPKQCLTSSKEAFVAN